MNISSETIKKEIENLEAAKANGEDLGLKIEKENEDGTVAVSPEDTEMLSRMLFDGRAEFEIDIKHVGKKAIVSTFSTNAYDLREEIVGDHYYMYRNDVDNSPITGNSVSLIRSDFINALTIVSIEGTDIDNNPMFSMKKIYESIDAYEDAKISKSISELRQYREDLYSIIKMRINKIRKIALPIIDFIGDERVNKERHLEKIVSAKGVMEK